MTRAQLSSDARRGAVVARRPRTIELPTAKNDFYIPHVGLPRLPDAKEKNASEFIQNFLCSVDLTRDVSNVGRQYALKNVDSTLNKFPTSAPSAPPSLLENACDMYQRIDESFTRLLVPLEGRKVRSNPQQQNRGRTPHRISRHPYDSPPLRRKDVYDQSFHPRQVAPFDRLSPDDKQAGIRLLVRKMALLLAVKTGQLNHMSEASAKKDAEAEKMKVLIRLLSYQLIKLKENSMTPTRPPPATAATASLSTDVQSPEAQTPNFPPSAKQRHLRPKQPKHQLHDDHNHYSPSPGAASTAAPPSSNRTCARHSQHDVPMRVKGKFRFLQSPDPSELDGRLGKTQREVEAQPRRSGQEEIPRRRASLPEYKILNREGGEELQYDDDGRGPFDHADRGEEVRDAPTASDVPFAVENETMVIRGVIRGRPQKKDRSQTERRTPAASTIVNESDVETEHFAASEVGHDFAGVGGGVNCFGEDVGGEAGKFQLIDGKNVLELALKPLMAAAEQVAFQVNGLLVDGQDASPTDDDMSPQQFSGGEFDGGGAAAEEESAGDVLDEISTLRGRVHRLQKDVARMSRREKRHSSNHRQSQRLSSSPHGSKQRSSRHRDTRRHPEEPHEHHNEPHKHYHHGGYHRRQQQRTPPHPHHFAQPPPPQMAWRSPLAPPPNVGTRLHHAHPNNYY